MPAPHPEQIVFRYRSTALRRIAFAPSKPLQIEDGQLLQKR